MVDKRAWWAAFIATALLAGCAPTGPPISPSSPPSVTATPTPTASPTPTAQAPDLADPGVASRVVKQLLMAGGNLPAVKVDVSRTVATVTMRTPANSIVAWSWVAGVVQRVDTDVEYFGQATFDPREFNLADVGGLFKEAQKLGASANDPQLQIVEYDPGLVLMTVTTRPESATVFFRKNGTPIEPVEIATVDGLTEALADALTYRTDIYAIGISPTSGVWVDSPGAADGTILRRTRHGRIPSFSALRNERQQWPTFDPRDVDPSLIVDITRQLRIDKGLLRADVITVTIDGSYARSAPTMNFTYPGGVYVTDLQGTDITPWVS